TFLSSSHAGVGGPNVAPPGDGPIAECVARAPGGPVHVLLTDREAEHIPGCNMAFRKACLEAIGGFDPRFRVAGDDVDVCWRLQERGWTLGFSPAAMVWHHRRNSLYAYWKQQIGYGRAEAMLERKWPEKYNGPGHVRWAGRIYGSGLAQPFGRSGARIYCGVWGGAPFQALYEPAPSLVRFLPKMPECHMMTATHRGMAARPALLWPVTASVWSERWEAPHTLLRALEARLRVDRACVLRGEEHDLWDLEVRGGILGAARLLMGVEDHPGGKQLIRLRWWPEVPGRGPFLTLGLAALTLIAAHVHAWLASLLLGFGTLVRALNIVAQCMPA